ncbi:MAG: DUF4198 domain-containing protein [Thermoanaerobaculia bacterium]|nr:DUF4198 domain-containing protein [Thermoanaerobaculia bacterium]
MRFGPILLPAALTLLAAAPAGAHDIWLQADDASLQPGDTLIVRQLLGEELAGALGGGEPARDLPLLLDMTPRFHLITSEGEIDLLSQAGDLVAASRAPVLERRVEGAGLALVAMSHSVLYTEATREEFLEYLAHEGLDPGGYREAMGADELQTEGYLRTLKCLVAVGPAAAGDDLHARVLGQEIEMVLRQNPYRLDPGDELEVGVLLRGEPLAGQTVKAYVAPPGETVIRLEAVTGADGVARFSLERPGLWLLRLVRLVPCSPVSPVDCDDNRWESYWSAYTFELD